MSETHAFCPKCRQDSAIDAVENCLWCGTSTKRKRGGWKRPDLAARTKISAEDLKRLYALHIEAGVSINELARQTYEKFGYASQKSAVVAISNQFRKAGLPARDRIEATRQASTIHGLAPKHGPRPGYSRFKLQRSGNERPICQGTVDQGKRKGEPCIKPSESGSDYCWNHNPNRVDQRHKQMAEMRSYMDRIERLPLQPLSEYLNRRHGELGTWKAVAEEVGVHQSLVHCYAHGKGGNRQPKDFITKPAAERLLGPEYESVYKELIHS